MTLLQGNNIDLLKELPDNSVDSVVTDPPYGLKFMNKKWDANVPSVDFWKEVFRVLKPGGHVLSFGGTRTYHRMAVGIEDAGFEIRDQIQWIYGSGFPKSLNLGNGWGTQLKPANEPICLARKPIEQDTIKANVEEWGTGGINIEEARVGDEIIASHLNEKKISNFGGVDKDKAKKEREPFSYTVYNKGRFPSNVIFECSCDPICLARKPIDQDTIKANVEEWGTGGVNIKDSRIPLSENENTSRKIYPKQGNGFLHTVNGSTTDNWKDGRFPSNVIFECSCDHICLARKPIDQDTIKANVEEWGTGGINIKDSRIPLSPNEDISRKVTPTPIDSSSIYLNVKYIGSHNDDWKDGRFPANVMFECHCDELVKSERDDTKYHHTNPECPCHILDNQWDKASRFFYVAKAGKKERNLGGTNTHPTVKPVELMKYLCRLITPKGGTVLDPFMGSGTTGMAAKLEGFDFIGMELDPKYFEIAQKRIEAS